MKGKHKPFFLIFPRFTLLDEMQSLNRGTSYEHNGQLCIELCDDYEHIDDSIEYVVENVLQTTNTQSESCFDLHEKFNSYIDLKCECHSNDNCTDETCIHGGNYVVHEDEELHEFELILNENRKSHDIIYECSEFCTCSPNCYNRLVQFGPRKYLKIENYSSLGKQYGLTTLKLIPRGAFICEYSGEILCKEETIERYRANDLNQKMNYIICLNERPMESKNGDGNEVIQTFIDPSRIGNIGRYLNHSCDPNCEIISVRVDGLIPKLGKNFHFEFSYIFHNHFFFL